MLKSRDLKNLFSHETQPFDSTASQGWSTQITLTLSYLRKPRLPHILFFYTCNIRGTNYGYRG